MPELPEVETIARALRLGGRSGLDGKPSPAIVSRKILSVAFTWQRTAASPSAAEIEKSLPGQAILSVGRRGKYLVLHLDRGWLIIHLRMSGDLTAVPVHTPLSPHDRFYADLEGGVRLAFNDTRKFGRVWLDNDLERFFAGLGPEPLSDDFTVLAFAKLLNRSKRQIKPFLLDQSVLAGMGNIYTDEALHRAGIHPLRLSHTLNDVETESLWAAIRSVLQEGIDRQGSSIDWVYRGGDFQNHFRVYQRTGLPCLTCGAPIERITLGQRGTHFCPHCQPASA